VPLARSSVGTLSLAIDPVQFVQKEKRNTKCKTRNDFHGNTILLCGKQFFSFSLQKALLELLRIE